MKDPIYKIEIFKDETIAASGTLENTTAPIVFGPRNANETENDKGASVGRLGSLALWLKLSGTGTLKAQAKCSGNDGVDYIIKEDIKVGMVAGEYLEPFAVPLCTHMTILLTETGGANSVVVEECNLISR